MIAGYSKFKTAWASIIVAYDFGDRTTIDLKVSWECLVKATPRRAASFGRARVKITV